MGLKEQILAAKDLEHVPHEVKEWGVTVFIRPMNGIERDALEGENFKVTAGKETTFNRQNFRARVLGRCLVDENGLRLFNDAELVQLGQKSAKVLDRLCAIASRISGITKEDEAELLGNSKAAPSAGAGSA